MVDTEVKKRIDELIDEYSQIPLYNLYQGYKTDGSKAYWESLISNLEENLQEQTSSLLKPDDFIVRYSDCYPIMIPNKILYLTTQSFRNGDDIDESQLLEYVYGSWYLWWKKKMLLNFSRTKPLYTPLFASYADLFSSFVGKTETVSEDYLQKSYPAPFGSVDTSYSTGAVQNTGTRSVMQKGSDSPDRLIRLNELANIADRYLTEFDSLFVGGSVL